MATPKVVTDGSSDLDEGVFNLFLNAIKSQVKLNAFRLLFTAATNVPTVVSTYFNEGEVVDGDLSWNAGGVYIAITLTGFVNKPLVFVTNIVSSATNVFQVQGAAAAVSEARVTFTNDAMTAAVDPDGNIEVSVFILGD